MIDRFERFSIAISEISRYWHKIAADELERYGLKGPHSIYLTTLYQFEDGITAARLAELCGRDKSDVSRMMTIMEEKGLVSRTGANNYRARLILTDKGREAAEYIRRRAVTAVSLAGRDLSPETRTAFYDALTSIASNLRELSRDGLPEESQG